MTSKELKPASYLEIADDNQHALTLQRHRNAVPNKYQLTEYIKDLFLDRFTDTLTALNVFNDATKFFACTLRISDVKEVLQELLADDFLTLKFVSAGNKFLALNHKKD